MARPLDRLFELERTKRAVHGVLDRLAQLPFRLYTRDPSYTGYLTPACYSPWNTDASFQEHYGRLEPYTLMDRYKAWGLWMLVQQSAKARGALMEVGVWRGGSGALIARRAALCGIADPVYLCDTFEGVVKAGDSDSHYRGGEHGDTSEEIVRDLVAREGLSRVVVVPGIFPDESGGTIEAVEIRFCHVDVDTYDSAKGIVDWLWPRLSSGGIVVYDDYGFPRCDGIRTFVEEQLDADDRVVLHNLNGQAVVIKR